MAKQSAAKNAGAEDLINDLDAGDPPAEPELATEVAELAPETGGELVEKLATKATMKAKAKPVAFDSASGVLTINDQHGSFETSLMGINPRIEWQLAAIGLASLLKGRIDKDKVIENIRAGQFGGKRKRKYPATVIAYANYQNITVEEAWAQWQAHSVPDRMLIRSMPKVRLELAKLADQAETK
jgi:hypothetical protein